MDFQDKMIRCSDCGTTFTFSADEQALFASKGYVNDPKRCFPCRQARRATRSDSGDYGYRPQRRMFSAVCANCNEECQVPFEPREGRAVYCSDCYSSFKPAR